MFHRAHRAHRAARKTNISMEGLFFPSGDGIESLAKNTTPAMMLKDSLSRGLLPHSKFKDWNPGFAWRHVTTERENKKALVASLFCRAPSLSGPTLPC